MRLRLSRAEFSVRFHIVGTGARVHIEQWTTIHRHLSMAITSIIDHLIGRVHLLPLGPHNSIRSHAPRALQSTACATSAGHLQGSRDLPGQRSMTNVDGGHFVWGGNVRRHANAICRAIGA